MACYISVRDIQFHASTTGVRIQAWTDVPSHLWARLSAQEPQIHRKTVMRRGLAWSEDLQFCFTAYDDNEQFEPGDTLVHTWWKTNWPVCTTKWLYLWGYQGVELCLSTSAIFKFHNDGISPVPPPDAMYQLNPLDPQYIVFSQVPDWTLKDLSYHIPEGATGVLLALQNTDIGMERAFALRKPGADYTIMQGLRRNSLTWVICGLDSARRLQYGGSYLGTIQAYIMGYTGRDVVFPDASINILPTAQNVYQNKNIGGTWPLAQLILTDMGDQSGFMGWHSIRANGSTKELFQYGYHCWPFCKVPADGFIQTKVNNFDLVQGKWRAYAYLKTGIATSLNGVSLAPLTINAWTTKQPTDLITPPRFSFIETSNTDSGPTISARKNWSYFNLIKASSVHNWVITHADQERRFQLYNGYKVPTALLLAQTM